MSDDGLARCPFCGSGADYEKGQDDDGRFVAVQCSGCGCGSGKHYPIMDDARPNAANEWNRRNLPTREELARAIYERQHMGLKACWAWDDSGLDDEHPHSRAIYYQHADAVLALLGRAGIFAA